MKVKNFTSKGFRALTEYCIPDVISTEAKLYLFDEKEKYSKRKMILKKYYNTSNTVFGNKVYTIGQLIDRREQIGIEELVFPESLVSINHELVGFSMPFIENINLGIILSSDEFSLEQKIGYLKEIGKLLEKISKSRKYCGQSDFFLNDIHENNFILNTQTNQINAIDIDSVKIGNNDVCPSKYLSLSSPIKDVNKYQRVTETFAGGVFVPNEDSELYCYIVMILNFIYGYRISYLNFSEYFIYLEYLRKLGMSNDLYEAFSRIYFDRPNINPYELLDEIKTIYYRGNYNVYNAVRKKSFF